MEDAFAFHSNRVSQRSLRKSANVARVGEPYPDVIDFPWL